MRYPTLTHRQFDVLRLLIERSAWVSGVEIRTIIDKRFDVPRTENAWYQLFQRLEPYVASRRVKQYVEYQVTAAGRKAVKRSIAFYEAHS